MQYNNRWSLVEYGSPYDLIEEISKFNNIPTIVIKEMLIKTGKRMQSSFGYKSNPIVIEDNGIRIVGIAGLIRLAPGIELEIAPKFLGLDSNNIDWREDFFFIATLSKYGHLLSAENLKSSSSERGDLHTLVARAITSMYWANHRRPLRNYRKRDFSDFAIDGDIELYDLLFPEPEGYKQTEIVFDRKNKYNSVILSAAKELLPNLRDPSVIALLDRMIFTLSPQKSSYKKAQKRILPNRSKRWQPLYDISVDILNGLGLSFLQGSSNAPGYIFDTWRVWEDLLGVGFRIGFGDQNVINQSSSTLGNREIMFEDQVIKSKNATVFPDYQISDTLQNFPDFIVDAKYKGNVKDGIRRINDSDLYEALAFAQATSINKIILAYPALIANSTNVGQVELFEKITVGEVIVYGVEIQSKGISRTSGLYNFSNRCSQGLKEIIR
jgi:5-methylcytosine-specific restriction enzyme subunit McrC